MAFCFALFLRIDLDVLEYYGIREKQEQFVMDNNSSNKSLVTTNTASFYEQGIAFNTEHRHLRCNGHIINLSAQALLFGQAVDDYDLFEDSESSITDVEFEKSRRIEPLDKLHNIVLSEYIIRVDSSCSKIELLL